MELGLKKIMRLIPGENYGFCFKPNKFIAAE